MSKIAVVYYSGSGNTEAMADVIVNALGADKIEAEAFGAAKAAAVFQMLYAKTTSYIPAAYLQIPPEVTVILDDAAAARL